MKGEWEAPPRDGCFDDVSRRRAAFRRLSGPQPGDSSPGTSPGTYPGTRGKELACTKLSDVFVPPFLIFEMGGPWGAFVSNCFDNSG